MIVKVLIALVFIVVSACSDAGSQQAQPATSQQPEAVKAGAEVDEKAAASKSEILLASVPKGATVSMEGAELGKTPFRLQVRNTLKILVSHEGYKSRELTVSNSSEPNMVVRLEKSPDAEEAATEAAAEPEKKTEEKPAVEPQVKKSAPAPKSTAKRTTKDSVSSVKQAYKSGAIDRDTYNQKIRQLKVKRSEKLGRLKERYKKGEIDRGEYDRLKRIIDNEYKGG